MSNFKELVRLGKDAVVRRTAQDKVVVGFTAAFDNGYGERKQTVWLDCSAWGERYEKVAPYLTKGAQIVVAGDLGTREHDGKTYVTLDVKDLKLTSKPSERNGEGTATKAATKPKAESREGAPAGALDDEIPF